MIRTTKGLLDETQLARTVGFEERPNEFVVWIEYRLVTPFNNGDAGELVRRDAHVILKEPSAVADAIVGGL